MSANAPAPILVDRVEEGELRTAILCLEGIFWALNMLVIHQAADEIAHKDDRNNGIAGLIMAGEKLTADLSHRF